MNTTELESTVRAMTARGKGLLAADESSGTIKKRFDTIGLESTETNRRDYRQMLFTTDALEQAVSGVILFDETIRQSTDDGRTLTSILQGKGIVPGIKVDKGTIAMGPGSAEKVTEGHDGLAKRYEEYYQLGARFAKWRAVYTISDQVPSWRNIRLNAQGLARYAAITQQSGLVPIVEPEVLMDGAHTLERCEDVTTAVLNAVFEALALEGVQLELMVLKPNMVISGKDCPVQASAEQVAAATVRCFSRTVPAAVPGIMFLSGGQSDAQATENLNAINALSAHHPWTFSFSYGRALQAPALKAWGGKKENVAAGQQALAKRARLNGAACRAEYQAAMEQAA
ncbi:MAG TPA: fructose-bisphosphate aldolase class I [Gammaproteobacteria bacterium]|nr:fructose-bisphosphate aldolase class I [Gammaproteobacteria bacterium]MCH77749.1 fructose-bisphosphate aldolase class I [Gammaproteobacteria bacterium]